MCVSPTGWSSPVYLDGRSSPVTEEGFLESANFSGPTSVFYPKFANFTAAPSLGPVWSSFAGLVWPWPGVQGLQLWPAGPQTGALQHRAAPCSPAQPHQHLPAGLPAAFFLESLRRSSGPWSLSPPPPPSLPPGESAILPHYLPLGPRGEGLARGHFILRPAVLLVTVPGGRVWA